VGVGILGGTMAGALPGAVKDVVNAGGAYVHSVTQTKIKDGSSVLLIQHNVLR
jgi:hypothetical protein